MKPWKEAASLILAARYGQTSAQTSSVQTYNYKILCLKRHSKSRTLPGTHVFPGGTVHPADTDLKWNSLFFKYGFDSNSFAPLFPKNKNRPIIFTRDPGNLPKEISLRITTIRETFEECGLLLCKQNMDSEKDSHWATHMPVSELELRSWQSRVHADASQFYEMCEKLKCYPDIWSLHEWSNWLTPASFPKRFNTVFFLTCMPFMPRANYEASEMEDLEWGTPRNYLDLANTLLFPPPQHYEFARLCTVTSLESLVKFAVKRRNNGIGMNLPVPVELQDGNVFLLPGDSMYPKDVSLTESQTVDKSEMTIDEFHATSPVKHRFQFIGSNAKRLIVENLEDEHGHLVPVPSETSFAFQNKAKI